MISYFTCTQKLTKARLINNNDNNPFITLNVHVTCLQHVRRDAARRAGLSVTDDPILDTERWARS